MIAKKEKVRPNRILARYNKRRHNQWADDKAAAEEAAEAEAEAMAMAMAMAGTHLPERTSRSELSREHFPVSTFQNTLSGEKCRTHTFQNTLSGEKCRTHTFQNAPSYVARCVARHQAAQSDVGDRGGDARHG
jgi:hypothetical protein